MDDTTQSKHHTLHTGMWSALESSVVDIEILLARADQGVATFALLMAVWFATVRPTVAGPLVILCVAVLIAATAAHWLLIRGRAIRQLRVLMPLVEITIPGAAFWIMATVEGPDYALGSWVPPQLFGFFIAASILRLQPAVPVLMGALAAAEFWGVFWFVIKNQVEGDAHVLHGTDVQIVRTGSLILAGLAGGAAVYGLRRIIGLASAAVRANELFGKYRLVRELASGGMGVVYEALYCPEGGFERQVAIKLIHPHLARDEGFVESFREEARLCAQLAHPNLVAALDFGRVNDTYFFAMEFVDGPTLWEIHDKRRRAGIPMEAGLVALIGAEVAEGLNFAHRVARGPDGNRLRVIHRDLSPANILIGITGQVKILDFGVARALQERTAIHTLNLVGKPSYMSPEQLESHRGDERSDLWSLAVMLWELLANTRLFRRENEGATLLAVVQDDIPAPSSIRSGLDPAWDSFFRDALSRDPEQRFPDALAFRNALREIAERAGANDTSMLVGLLSLTPAPGPPLEADDVELLDLDE